MSNRQSELLTKVLAKLYAEKEARLRAEGNCQLYTRTYAEEIVRLKKQMEESVNRLKNELQARERIYARKMAEFRAAAIGQTAKNRARLEEKLANSEKVRQRAEEKAATEEKIKAAWDRF